MITARGDKVPDEIGILGQGEQPGGKVVGILVVEDTAHLYRLAAILRVHERDLAPDHPADDGGTGGGIRGRIRKRLEKARVRGAPEADLPNHVEFLPPAEIDEIAPKFLHLLRRGDAQGRRFPVADEPPVGIPLPPIGRHRRRVGRGDHQSAIAGLARMPEGNAFLRKIDQRIQVNGVEPEPQHRLEHVVEPLRRRPRLPAGEHVHVLIVEKPGPPPDMGCRGGDDETGRQIDPVQPCGMPVRKEPQRR
ncbi:MAG: hypothetical protein HYV75_07885, partial [Opitutae bacterium]|nr:hypothetical protein [Opitutae bacterium]